MLREYVKIMAIAVLIIAFAMLAAYALGWIRVPLELTSPENLQRLSREANDEWQALEAKYLSIQSIERQAEQMVAVYGDDQSIWPQGKREEYLQLQFQINNLKISYNNQCAQYNAFWRDEWRAVPAPNDIPTRCEFLS